MGGREGECESSEKELGNPRAGERRRLWHAMYRASTWHASKASADQPFSSLFVGSHLLNLDALELTLYAFPMSKIL